MDTTENITNYITIKSKYSPYTEITHNDKINYDTIKINVPAKFKIKMIQYELLPGIIVFETDTDLIQRYVYEDHVLEYKNPEDLIILDYLIEGQGQAGIDKNKFIPLKQEDAYIHSIPQSGVNYSFYGKNNILHIVINKTQIYQKNKFTLEYYEFVEKLLKIVQEEQIIILKNKDKIKEIMNEIRLFESDDITTRKIIYQIKIIEIIVYLYQFNLKNDTEIHKTYTDAQIRVVRKIKNHLSRDIASYISLEVLSNSYGINLTTLKNCFRDMYGKPLYTWYREYKFHRAAELIKNTKYPISRIANMIGYKSSSKFTKAFKKEMGILPSDYRKNKD